MKTIWQQVRASACAVLSTGGTAIAGAAIPWQTWEAPDREVWLATATVGDSDEDAIYALHRGWYRDWGESSWELGWEIGLGLADSGKYDRHGALASLDLMLGRKLWTWGGVELGIVGAAGLQVHTIEFPGGSYYNGRLGLAWELRPATDGAEGLALRLGYLHVSNANLGPGNEGIDAFWLGGGWSW